MTMSSFFMSVLLTIFISLIMVQLLGGFLSFGATGGSGFGTGTINVNMSVYSAGFVVMLTYVWGFFSGFLITNQVWRDDYIFVANRLSSNVANTLVLGVAAAAGGFTSVMWSFILKIIHIWTDDVMTETGTLLFAAPGELFMGLIAASLYTFLFALAGYTLGVLWHRSKLLLFFIPVFLTGAAYLFPGNVFEWTYAFFFSESSFWLFVIKTLATSAVLLCIGLVVTKRMEVRT